jgi:1-acyl-sn-glycerol-3-phosphate acyltransferase
MKLSKEKSKYEYGNIPNSLLYYLICKLSKAFLKVKYNVEIKNSCIENMKPPFIVLGNHPSSLDPFIMAASMYPHRMNFLGTNYYFRNPLLRPLLRIGGIIPKIQAYKDTRAVRMMNKVISRGGILAICPEGRRSTVGSQYRISDSIAKLIKLYKVPVVTVVSNGAYLSKPRWSASPRRGSIEVNVQQVLTTQQIQELSLEEVKSVACSSIYYNDYEWNKNKKVSFKNNKSAENIHNILHMCPKCGSEKAMISGDARLYCKLCGNAALMNEYGFLIPESESSTIYEDASKWLIWQRKQARQAIKNSYFEIRSKVTKLRIADAFTGSYRNAGYGNIVYNHNGLIFQGIIDGQQGQLIFPISVLSSISSEFGVNFEITDGKNTYCFFLEDGQDVIRIELAIVAFGDSDIALKPN